MSALKKPRVAPGAGDFDDGDLFDNPDEMELEAMLKEDDPLMGSPVPEELEGEGAAAGAGSAVSAGAGAGAGTGSAAGAGGTGSAAGAGPAAPVWQRPAAPAIDPKKDSIAFQWLSVDMTNGDPLPANPASGRRVAGSKQAPVPIIQFYGVTDAGNSVMVHVHGFTPYLYFPPPPGCTRDSLPAIKRFLDKAMENTQAAKREKELKERVLAVELVPDLASLLGFRGGARMPFLKVYVAMPTLIPPLRKLLEDGTTLPGFPYKAFPVFEANMPFILRFMIDRDITGCCWLELPAATYSLRPKEPARMFAKKSSCQIEADIVYDSLVAHAPEGEWQRIAPFRILSFDIECAGRKGVFPEPEHDPVIQIANVVTRQGQSTPDLKNVFVLDTCTPIVGANVLSFEKEWDLLDQWARFVRETDCDILTGYNVQNFDIPYLLNRAKKLKVRNFTLLGRIKGKHSVMRDTTFQSSAFGKRENVETSIDGRTLVDMLPYMRRNHKLSSYSLNAVSAHFLGQQKEDVHHSIISDLQRGSPDDRHRLAVYCLKDALLPQRLMDKLMVLVNNFEMARVTGVPLDFLTSRGQQIKVLSMLYRKCRRQRLVIPSLRKSRGGSEEGGYEGATVIEPIKGFYDVPIATLDFASLYPSIMMAHNLCYSTLVARDDVSKLPAESFERTPSGDVFVKKDVAKGVLPEILEELLSARSIAKKDMAKATDPMVKAVQNGRQLALKISANSVYGFTGATVGQLPCLPISSSVTAYGREMINQTKAAVEENYTVAKGYPADAQVVYGDTDSVMVKFGVPDVPTAMKLGEEAADEVSKLFPSPVKLEFEKVYFPYLLMNKKRYAGMYYTKPDKWDKMDTKGIETVRRDNCALVRNLIDTCLRKILMERSVEAAIAYTKSVISDLLQNKLDISLLVITKALGKSADSDDYVAKQAHVELAERMRKRDPGTAPAVGDRVPYVIIQAAKGTAAYEKSEDPVYVLEKNIPIDNTYYLENQLSKPLMRIFGPIMDRPESLLHGDHTRTVYKATPATKSGIMAFTVKQTLCMGCKTPIKKHATLCAHCKPKEGEVYRKTLSKVTELEQRFSRLWTQCQRCQGSLHQDVLCSSRDCPIFYMRKKVQKDLKDSTEKLDRFEKDGLMW